MPSSGDNSQVELIRFRGHPIASDREVADALGVHPNL